MPEKNTRENNASLESINTKKQDQLSVEHEVKFLLSRDNFDSIYQKAAALDGRICCSDCVQINYYYDTGDFALRKAGVTCRIRQIGPSLSLQIKRRIAGCANSSEEQHRKLDSLPAEAEYEGIRAELLGNLITRRRSLIFDGFRLDFDENSYLGAFDTELEAEYDNGRLEEGMGVLEQLGVAAERNSLGKAGRFAKKLKSIGGRVCV